MTRTGVHEGVRFIRTEASLLGIPLAYFVYEVDGLLVDTGPYSQRRRILPFLEKHPPRQVVLTHAHEDHCGLAAWVQERFGVPVMVHEAYHEEARADARLPIYRRLAWGARPAFHPDPLPEVVVTPHHRFEVLPSPGHTAHHVVLLERERKWLFTGDFYLGVSQVVAFEDEVADHAVASMRAMLELEVDTLFTAHAGVITDGRLRFRERLAFLEDLRGKVVDLRARGLSDRQIARRLLPRRKLITLVSAGEWSTRNLVRGLGREE